MSSTPDALVDALLAESAELVKRESGVLPDEARIRTLAARKAILALDRRGRIDWLLASVGRCPDSSDWRSPEYTTRKVQAAVLQAVRVAVLRRDLAPDAAELVALLDAVLAMDAEPATAGHEYPAALLQLAKIGVANGCTEAVRERAERIRKVLGRSGKQRRDFDALLGVGATLDFEPGEAWSDLARAELAALAPGERAAWKELLAHAMRSGTTAQPDSEWRDGVAARVAAIGADRFVDRFARWAGAVVAPKQRPPGWGSWHGISPGNADLLRGLVWCCARIDSPAVSPALVALAEQTYARIPRHGPFNRKVANACLRVLGERNAVPELYRLSQRVKFELGASLIGGRLDEAAAHAGITRAELEDENVPTFGVESDGVVRRSFGDVTAELRLDGVGDPTVAWVGADGRARAAPPKSAKVAFPKAAREMRDLAKDIGRTLRGERARLEASFLPGREQPLAAWRERWLGHPLLARFATALLWSVGAAPGTVVSAVGGELRDLAGRSPKRLAKDAPIRLWHPLDTDPETILAWRRRLGELGVRQPFKQAHREVYLLTPAERETHDFSNRFAAHVLKQHPLAALCRERGWRYSMQGPYDFWSAPTRDLPGGLCVEFHVPVAPGRVSESGVALLLLSDKVVFRESGHDGRPVPLADVPALVFSEAMREIDLFVSVASIGNDPTWVERRDGRFGDYWRGYAFGELPASARIRREVLESLLPALSIADRCRLADRWLEVAGSLATYRIHLGSGNVLMEPGSRYLCIVEAHGSREVALPFEGDGLLGVILSKAFFLADDASIEDETIVRQIRR